MNRFQKEGLQNLWLRYTNRPLAALNRLRFRRTLSALLVLAVLALTAAFVENLFQPRGRTVADAQSQLKRTQANLETATRVVNSADRLAQRIGSTNSPPRQTIQSIGQSVIHKLERENIKASVDVAIAHRIEAADHCVQRYKDFNQAQEAMATLNLSGIDDVVIRPPEQSGFEGRQSLYELMVPHGLAAEGVAALQSMQIRELKRFGDAYDGIVEEKKLVKQGVRATVRPLKPPGQVDTPDRVWVLYVQRADEETAKALLDGSTNINGNMF